MGELILGKARNFEIPADMAVVSYNNSTWGDCNPAVTSVDNLRKLGRKMRFNSPGDDYQGN